MSDQWKEYQPKLQPQLDGSKTGGDDCGPRATSTAIDWATKGNKVPSVADVRKRMLEPLGATDSGDAQRALASYDTVKETGGMSDVRSWRRLRRPEGELRDVIARGDGAVCYIDYGVINRDAPELSGVPTFDEGHAIFVMLQRVRDGQVQWKVWDSTCDGRRKGIPKGPNWWPRWVIEKASAAFCKARDTETWVTVKQSWDVTP